MSNDALFQLGIASVFLNTSQTEISPRGLYPNTPEFRAPTRANVSMGRLSTTCRGSAGAKCVHLFHLQHLRRQPGLQRGHLHS